MHYLAAINPVHYYKVIAINVDIGLEYHLIANRRGLLELVWRFFLWFGIEKFNHCPSNLACLIQDYFSAAFHVGFSSYLKCTVSQSTS